MTTKVDLVKEDKNYYKAGRKSDVLNLGSTAYLSIEGRGAPGGKEFLLKLEALYPLAYGVKKICKVEGNDFAVPKLEGLWWLTGNRSILDAPKEQWHWKLLIRMPDFVTKNTVEKAKEEVIKKKNNDLIRMITFEKIDEGKCAQVMHLGPYSEEKATIDNLLTYIAENGMTVNGLHHEIYLSDPNKTAQEKMKTIIRYPVQ